MCSYYRVKFLSYLVKLALVSHFVCRLLPSSTFPSSLSLLLLFLFLFYSCALPPGPTLVPIPLLYPVSFFFTLFLFLFLFHASFSSSIYLLSLSFPFIPQTFFSKAVSNDTFFLSIISVVDYSILVGFDEDSHEIVVGIIDYMRQVRM
jgi:hypothetical protein